MGCETPARLATSRLVILLTANGEFFKEPPFKDAYMYPPITRKKFRGWTDDYSNLFQILNFK